MTAKRDKAIAMRFFKKTTNSNDVPEKVAMDKRGANEAAIDQIIKNNDTSIVIRQVKYLNNIVEQDHQAVKRTTKPMLGFKFFQSAKNILSGIKFMHMIHKGQLMMEGAEEMLFAEQFYALAR